MTSRLWGETQAYIWELSEINTTGSGGSPFSHGGVSALTNIVPDSVEWTRILSAVGRGRVTFYATQGWENFLVAGRVCVVVKPISGYPGIVYRVLAVFLIEEVRPSTNAGKVGIVEVSGPGLEHLLSKRLIWGPVGEETLLETTLAEEALAPTFTEVVGTMDANDDTVTLDSFTHADKDNEIRIQMDDDNWHVSRIIELNPKDTQENSVQIADPVPVAASTGNAIEIRTAKIGLDNTENFAVDQTVHVYGGPAGAFETQIIDIRLPKSRVVLADGLPHGAAVGTAVIAFDYNAPSHSDVTKVMQYAPDWDVVFQTGSGTEVGTAHIADGESVLDLLLTISERAGEFWRTEIAALGVPQFRIAWRRSPDASDDFRLVMYNSYQHALQASDELDYDRGAIIRLSKQKTRQLITRVYPRPGSGTLSLSECSAAALYNASVDGYTVGIATERYDRDYVERAELVTEFGEHSVQEIYGDIAVDDKMNAIGRSGAADQMLYAAQYTIAQANYRNFYTIECYTPQLLKPGQYIGIENETGTTPRVEWPTSMIVLEVTERLVDGRPRTTLVVSDSTGLRRTGAIAYAQTIRSLIQTTKRLGAAAASSVDTRGGGETAGGGGTATDHGTLTGLTDDDHPQYLRSDGGRTLTGNLAVAPGVTIDGVDLSALPGGHTPVTAYNFGIRIENDQQVGVKLTSLPSGLGIRSATGVEGLTVYLHTTDSGLELASDGMKLAATVAGDGINLTGGVLSVKTSTALGTKVVTDVVGVDAWASGGLFNGATGLQIKLPSTSGLQVDATGLLVKLPSISGLLIDANGLAVKLPTNSGLVRDATGLYLSPSTLTAATTNAVATSGHTHAITATDNANTTTGALLKGSAVGYLTLAGLGVGDTATGAAAATLKAKAVDDYTLYMKQLSGQTASMLRVEATAGHALIILTGEGDLESGNPGFVSGMTGWQIESTGNAEFNNVSVRGELHAVTFVADEMHATGGTLAVMTATTVADPVGANDNKLPALGATFTLNVTASYNTGLPYFATGDIIRIKHMGKVTSGAALDLYDIYLQVQTVGALTGDDLTEGEPGYHPLTCYRRNGGATNLVIPAGAAVVRWGKVSAGAGTYTGGIILTSDMAQSPYIDIFTIDANQTGTTWQTAPVTPTPRVRVGNLDGVLGLSEQWGLAAGVDLTDTNVITQKYIVASSAGLQLRNIDLKIYGAASPTIEMSNTGDVEFGTDINSDATTSFRHYPLNGALRIGPLVSGKPNLYWDGTDLHLRQHTTPVISLEASGDSNFSGVMTIGVNGEIRQGSGTVGTLGVWAGATWGTFTGLRIGRSSTIGRLATYKTGIKQIELDSDGKLVIGDYGMTLDKNGMSIYPNGVWSGGDAGIRFLTPAGTQFGKLYNYAGTGFYSVLLSTEIAGHTAGLGVGTHATGTHTRAYLYADTTVLTLSSDNTVAELSNADFYIKERGLAIGYTTTPSLNRGQIASDLAGEHDFNTVVLQDTGKIAHGMTAIANTATYGALSKFDNALGGLDVQGFSESVGALELLGHGGAASTTKTTGSLGGVVVTARLKSGTSAGSYGANGNLFVVRNNTTTRFIIDAEGDFHYDGTGAAYDAYDDPALLATLNREAWGGAIDSEWHRFIDYNRQSLIDAGILSDGGFINGAALHRLLVGAIGQLATRLNKLEGN
jgi:hypothetical protein